MESPGSGTPPSGVAGPTPTAIVLSADEEMRVLLRGLLRLNHFRVVGESDDPRQAADLVASQRPQVLVADSGPMQTPLGDLVARSRSAVEGLRIVVVTNSPKSTQRPAGAREADAVLVRPFRVRQFSEALGTPPA